MERRKNIVDHVRLFSSQQKNQIDKIFQIKSVIVNALAMIGRQLTKREIELRLNLEDNLCKIRGNPFKLEQLLINLLTNARDALLEKESKTADPYKKKIEISTSCQDNFIILRVTDNGIGLQPNQANQIFRPFYTTKKLGKGTGLGLSIVQEIIEEFGGQKNIKSEYMKGTVFEIQIPLHLEHRHQIDKAGDKQVIKVKRNYRNNNERRQLN
jgi:C4-dicarboxylate-specific signal transduction histidine kinase